MKSADAQFMNWTRGLIAVVASVYLAQGLFLIFGPGLERGVFTFS